MAIASDHKEAARMGLSAVNAAVLSGLTDAQISGATGVANLRAVIEGLAPTPGSAPDALTKISTGIQWGANCGVLTDANIVSATGAADLRNLFTAELGDISPLYTGQLPQ